MEDSIHRRGTNPASEINSIVENRKKENRKNIFELVELMSNPEISEQNLDEVVERVLSVLELKGAEELAQELLKLENDKLDNAKAILEKIFPEKHIPAFEYLDLEMKKELNEKFGLKLNEN